MKAKNMSIETESQPKILDEATLKSEDQTLSEMLMEDRKSGLSPEDDAAYKELIKENRESFIAFNQAGESVSVESAGSGPAPVAEQNRTSALDDDTIDQAREAVMRQFGNIEDSWQLNNK